MTSQSYFFNIHHFVKVLRLLHQVEVFMWEKVAVGVAMPYDVCYGKMKDRLLNICGYDTKRNSCQDLKQ